MTDALVRERSDQAGDTLYPRRRDRQEKPRLSLCFSQRPPRTTRAGRHLEVQCARPFWMDLVDLGAQSLSRSPAAYLRSTQQQSPTIGHVLSKTLN